MTAAERKRTLIIGIFTFIALGILTVAILTVGRKSGAFVQTYRLTAVFPTVQGLAAGQPVWLNGLSVGMVENIQLTPVGNPGVEVLLNIEQQYQEWIRQDSLARLESKGIVGDKIINITIGSPDSQVLHNGSDIHTVPPTDFAGLMGNAGEVVAGVSQLVESVKQFAESLTAGEGTLAKLVTEDQLYREVVTATHNISLLMGQISSGEGTLGKLVQDDAVYGHIEKVTGRLANGEGSVGRLLAEDTLYVQLTKSLDSLSSIVASVEAAEGSVGQAVMKPELHNEIQGLIDSITTFTEDLKENPERYVHFSVF